MSLPREVVDVSITSPGIGGGSRNMPIDLNEMLVPSAVVDVSITSPGIGGGSRNMPIDLNEMLVPSAGESSTALDLNEVVDMIEVADPGQ
ncbi:hypothetical protein LINPERPRIM_LOCUS26151 [Linum perenne]